MIRIAGGEPCVSARMRHTRDGHAIEVRVNAEDPANNFMPFPGVVGELLARTAPACASTTMLYRGLRRCRRSTTRCSAS
jgi:acetyl-CoA carboxylase biotin carboxylase subunit